MKPNADTRRNFLKDFISILGQHYPQRYGDFDLLGAGTFGFKFKDLQTNTFLFIKLNSILQIATTNLLNLYNRNDQRFHKLGCYLRYWKPR